MPNMLLNKPTTTVVDWGQAACHDHAAIFANEALDYYPDDPDINYAPLEHAEAADAKRKAEAAAIQICATCPIREACLQNALTVEVYGVAGGLTQAERRTDAAPRAEAAYSERDRGARNQINDLAAAEKARQGLTIREIAEDLGCTTRSVVRARKRLAEGTPTPVTPRNEDTAATTSRGSERLSGAMQAIYKTLDGGEWCNKADLHKIGAPHVTENQALRWFERRHKDDATTSHTERVRKGSILFTENALAASARIRKRTQRGGPDGTNADLFRLNPNTPTRWAPTGR